VLSALAFLALGLMAVVRFGVLTDAGRAFVVRQLDGLDLGSVGRLRVAGLKGDLWTEFSLDRLSIVDSHGAWLDLSHLRVAWTPLELLSRRAHIQLLLADQLTLAHRPAGAAGGGVGLRPVAVRIDRLATRLETLPAFSIEHGLFQVEASLDLERDGGVAGDVEAQNLVHLGDGLNATFDLGVGKQVVLDAHARESRGGALAGVLGLPTAKAFNLDAKAGGDVDAGLLKLMAASGDERIAEADGAWTKAGGSAKGWVSLAASRWTASYLQALGPRLSFNVQQGRADHGGKQILAQLAADNLSLSLAGLVDTAKRRSDQGLKAQLRVKDLSKLLAQPAAGPGQFDGVLKGAPGDWDLQGQVGAERLAFDGYSLASAKGAAHAAYHQRELRLTATANGLGGQGAGLLAALAGARPHISLDTSRLADGRLLLRDLQAEGAGLKVTATGGKGLLGDLSFKGQGQLSNLSAARAGAKGAIEVKWSASQFRAKQPWKFNLDANASGLATGEAHLDHLLGQKPRLTTDAAYGDGILTFGKLDLAGAAARASGSGTVGKDGALKLLLDWSAEGPFEAGPVEIAGKARGSGTITGALATPRADLGADFERIDLPQLSLTGARVTASILRGPVGVDGAVSLVAADASGPAHAKMGFHVHDGGVDLQDLDAAGGGLVAHGAFSWRNGAIPSADLTLTAGPGAFLAQGRADARLKITDQGAAPSADTSLTANNLVLKRSTVLVRTLSLNAKGPLSQLPYAVVAEIQAEQGLVRLNGNGTSSQTGKGFAFSFNGAGRFRQADFHTLSPARITIDGADRAAHMDLAVGGGRAQIQADQNNAGLDAKAVLAGVDLGALGEDLAGHVDADLSLTGQGEHLEGRLDAHLKGARSRDAPAKLALNGSVNASLSGPQVIVDAAVDGAASDGHASVHAVLPSVATAAPFRIAIDQTKPISGQFAVNGELQPVWDLFFGDGRELGGQLTAKGDLGGSLNKPQVTGHGSLVHGRFEDAATGLKLRELAAEVDLQGEALDVQRFSANDAHTGTLSGQGRLEVGPNAASTLTLNAHGFQLLDNELAKATASGAVTVVREANGQAKLSGDLTIDRADISAESSRSPSGVVAMDVVERNKPFSPAQGLQAQATKGPSIDLDVSIKAPRRIFVRGLGLDAELSLDARVVGATSNPVLTGTANIVRGDYDFAGKRFTIDDRGVVYLASSPDKIRLDLTATRDDPSLTAIIRIQGTAAKPQITLTSTPTLPDDEVLSQVLFGQSAAQLSPVEAAQLAAAVTTLATGGGFDVMGGLKNFARLDRLALGGGDAATGVTVSGGKYIGSRVYLELTGGGRQGASAQVEIKATKALSFLSQIGGETGAKLSVRWRHDYGRAPPVGK
jgi:translocation and assembly module TamB